MMNFKIQFGILGLAILLGVSGCTSLPEGGDTLFTLINSDHSNIRFANNLNPTDDFNIYTYRNYYNGGGVAIGDVNNDTLPDIYFTSNQGDNKLYINEGNFKFKDVSDDAGVTGKQAWSTGVTMVDVNGDGWMDIHVCNSGDVQGDLKKNELFINQKDGTFIEEAEGWGIADEGYSTHAAFFDYDKDGDLDLYLLNNSYRAIGSFNLQENERTIRDPKGGDKLFRNDGNSFVDVSESAGIYGSIIGFGLGVTVGDVDKDGWQDIYVSNDFFERDYLYINNQDGTFKEVLEDRMSSISVASMGADMADINNDGQLDIFVTEMLPNDYQRLKTKTTFENWNKYQFNLKHDYYHQFTRNMLHVNRGDGTYAEIGRLAGVEATDWSWGALIEDFDNDGLKDIFVANGIAQDLTDQDYLNFLSSQETIESMVEDGKVNYKKLIDAIPSEKISNFFFRNLNGRQFEDQTREVGLYIPSFSNGSAYGDLDLDGDLDLVVNNVNMEAFIYRNNASDNFIQIELRGKGMNTQAIGSKLYGYQGERILYQEFMPMKGFQSSMDYILHLGLGQQALDSLVIEWPNRVRTVIIQPEINKRHFVQVPEGPIVNNTILAASSIKLFEDDSDKIRLSFVHKENSYSDFDNERLLFHMNSTEGPKVKVADLNMDGLDDIIFAGSKGNATGIFFQNRNGSFTKNASISNLSFNGEDQDFGLIDFDGDEDLDVYVARGGTDFSPLSSDMIDKLWINDGRGNLAEQNAGLQDNLYSSTSAIDVADFNGDGKDDLIIAERMRVGQYGLPVSASLMVNEGGGKFKNVTRDIAPDLEQKGMFTDIEFADIDNDGALDIVATGHYMGIELFIQENGKFSNRSSSLGLDSIQGWYNTLHTADIDNDGDLDIIAGNHGLNSRMQVSLEDPIYLNLGDFDRNGKMDQVLCQVIDGKLRPLALKHDLEQQMPILKKKFVEYNLFAQQGFNELFNEEERKNMISLPIFELRSLVLINNGDQGFDIKALPIEAQYSPIFAIHSDDVNDDGLLDLVIGGNLYEVKPEVGRYDALKGLLLLNSGNGNFEAIPSQRSGINIKGQIRDFEKIIVAGSEYLLVARNNDTPVFLRKSE